MIRFQLCMSLVLAWMIVPATACFATTFYVSPTGSDQNPGTEAAPWQTLGPAAGIIQNSCRILIQAGTTVTGSLYITEPNFTLGTYPSDGTAATVLSGSHSGIFLQDTGGLTVTNINFVGSGASNTAGIYLYTSVANVKQSNFVIQNCSCSGYEYGGFVCGLIGTAGFTDLTVTDSAFFDNQICGFCSYAASPFSHLDWTLSDCEFYDNYGVIGQNSGSGLCLGDVDGATVSACTANDNGDPGTGGVGIWTYESTLVTIEDCTSHDNHTGGSSDGDGFDLDGGVTDSVIENCNSYSNNGAGFLACQYTGATPETGNKIVDNTSTNDGTKNYGSGIVVSSTCSDLLINGNQVFAKPGSCLGGAISEVNWNGSGVTLSDNTINVYAAPSTVPINWKNKVGVKFENNTIVP